MVANIKSIKRKDWSKRFAVLELDQYSMINIINLLRNCRTLENIISICCAYSSNSTSSDNIIS